MDLAEFNWIQGQFYDRILMDRSFPMLFNVVLCWQKETERYSLSIFGASIYSSPPMGSASNSLLRHVPSCQTSSPHLTHVSLEIIEVRFFPH